MAPVGHAGHAEVDHPRAGRAQQHVAGLQVAVHDPGRMDGREGAGHADGQGVQAGRGQRALLAHDPVEGRAGHVLADDVLHAPGEAVEVGVQHRRGAEGRHPAGGGHFAPEPLAQLGTMGQLGPDDLQRDEVAALERPGRVDHPHAARAETAEQLVLAEPGRVVGAKRAPGGRLGGVRVGMHDGSIQVGSAGTGGGPRRT
jgi:hypothetical protein